jgi:hypothetical protein
MKPMPHNRKTREESNPSPLGRRGSKKRSIEPDVMSIILPSISGKKENLSKKVRVRVRTVLKRLRVKANDKELVKKLKMEDERLRQRVEALGARIRRYNEAAKKREEGALFAANQKGFYRQLEKS